ncbi:uncharacterized protein LOC108199961 [Daucus carota subsp. sativus]|uniref:Uncharacterized protein n=2 Tax=Daucus carota subsp. sativus TaxID=79200 RepID=A0A175YN85_DAUCS|nr:PREDICTED: uncharacterized protein LOC108199961 [Daucus carota subsp. sativus]
MYWWKMKMLSCNTRMLFSRYKLQNPLCFITKCNTFKFYFSTSAITDSSSIADCLPLTRKPNQTYPVYRERGIESSSGADSFVKLFQQFGFSDTHITRILSKQPAILAYRPQKYLKPKLDFLISVTSCETDVVNIVTKNPFILTRSLDNHLRPLFDSLKSAAGSNENAAAVIKCNPFMLSFCNSSSFVRNVQFLQTVGVPRNQILKMITKYGQSVGVKHDKFCKVVLKVKDMGFDLSSSYFREAVLCLSFLTESAWESRCEVYRSFGLSNHDIITMFKKQPAVMSFSEKRIWEMLDFFVHRLRWSPSRLSTTPNVFLFGLEKRIIPRCSVLQALVSNKCDIKDIMLQTILKMDESRFLKTFVTKYEDKVPEIMDAYQGKLTFGDYNFESESKGKIKIINSNRTISTMATTDSLALSPLLLEQSSDEKGHESVIKLFKSFGFSENHVARIVRKQPSIISFHPQKSVKPKLDYLFSITQSRSEVFDVVAKNPVILGRSLKNHIIPFFTSLGTLTGNDQHVFAAIKRNPYLLSNCVSTTFLHNIDFLQKLGVPQIQIMKLITEYGQSIGGSHAKFRKVVLKVKDMGFDLSSSCFLDAVRSFSFLSDLAWESRCEMLRSFGFSDHDISSMAKKQPVIMNFSERRMRDLLEFFVQKLRWSATKLSTSPNILRYSLEKRIIPRCSVLQALALNNCNSKRLLLTYIVKMTESRFLERFVTAYKDEVPEVMDAYRGKLRFDEFNFESES